MERQPELESLDLNPMHANGEDAGRDASVVPQIALPVLFLLMLMPWLWVSLGLLVLGDYRLAILMYELLGCALPVFLLGHRHLPVWPLRFNLTLLVLMALCVGSLIIMVFRASNGFGMNWPLFHEQATHTKLAINGSFWVFALVIGCINPFLEEAFWRGLIYQSWRAKVGVVKARWISSFFFGAWHWLVLQQFCTPVWAVVLTLWVVIGGLAFCVLYEQTRSLGASVLLHGLGADFPMIYVVYDCVMRPIQ